MQAAQTEMKMGITFAALEKLAILPKDYNVTTRKAQEDPEKNILIQKAANEVELEENLKMMGPGYEPFDKKTSLIHIEVIELHKV